MWRAIPMHVRLFLRFIAQWAVFMFVAFCWLPYKQWLKQRSREMRRAERTFLEALREIQPRKTKAPVVVLMVGVVGSGKTPVAKMIGRLIGATLIEGSAIYEHLLKMRVHDGGVRRIAEEATLLALKQGGNVVVDRDNVGPLGHMSLRVRSAVLRRARVYTVRTTADISKIVLRVLTGQFDDFTTDVSAKLTLRLGNGLEHLQRLCELACRLPLHYVAERRSDPTMRLRRLPFPVLATVDTTRRGWQRDVTRLAKRIAEDAGRSP